jgi:uncharacterized protein (TIGR04255 family)
VPQYDPHPQYPRPPIVEATCDISLDLGSKDLRTPEKVGKFIQLIQKKYPSVEARADFELNFEQKEGSIQQQISTGPPRFRFRHKNEQLMIQLGKDRVSVHALAPYQSWSMLLSEVEWVWPHIGNIFQPVAVKRSGVRYINRIPLYGQTHRPSYWLNKTNFLPKALLDSIPPFLGRIETRTDDANRVIVSVAYNSEKTGETPFGSVIFDIDVIREGTMSEKLADILENLMELHEIEWKVFSDARSRRLERWMNEDE